MKFTSKVLATLLLGAAYLSGCDSLPAPNPIAPQKPDIGEWHIEEPKINAIDGTKTQMITTGDIGSNLVLCFKNGKLCGSGSSGVFVTSPCSIIGEEAASYRRQVRLRFDDEKFLVETWDITDDQRAISPEAKENFIASLKSHKIFAIEFGCARSDSDVIIFQIHGLQAAIDAAGLKL